MTVSPGLRYGPCGLSFVLGFKKIDENRESNRVTERRQCVEVTRALMIERYLKGGN